MEKWCARICLYKITRVDNRLASYEDILWSLLAIFLRHEDCVMSPKDVCVEG